MSDSVPTPPIENFTVQEVTDDPSCDSMDAMENTRRRVAKMLFISFICPLLMFSVLEGGSTKFLFFWSLLAMGGAMIVWTLLPAVAGGALVACGRMLRGKSMAVALLCTGLAVLSGMCFLDLDDEGLLVGSPLSAPGDSSLALFVILLAGVAIAAGNRLRKSFPMEMLPATVMAAGGVVFCGLFFLPVIDGDSAISFLVSAQAWSNDFLGNLLLLVVFCFGLFGVLAPLRLPQLEFTETAITAFHRIVTFGFPLVILIGRTASASGFETAMTGGSPMIVGFWAFKVITVWYCAVILIASGMTHWTALHLWQRAGGHAAPSD